MAVQPVARVRRTSQNTQYTYNLSKRIHDVKTYPILSPQGATILIYGHDNGVTLVWRGGRRFKPSKKAPAPPVKEKVNGANADIIMLDSDDEDDPPAKNKPGVAFVDKPEFEDAADVDDADPEIVQTLELALGAAALHIAVLPITPCAAEDASFAGAELFKEKIVFAVSTSAADAYIVSLPLTPPSPESKARPELRSSLLAANAGGGQWGDVITVLTGQTRHSEGIAISLTKPSRSSATTDRIREQTGSSNVSAKARLVVATHNREASGVLRFWDVPAESVVQGGEKARIKPFQTEYLSQPLRNISFNPTNSSQLLVVSPSEAVRIFDYAAASLPPDDQSTGPFPSKGSWLVSLYQPFIRPTGTRKPIIDAAWISHGRAVFVVLADGTWGIWDIEGASPLGSTLLGKQSSGIKGAALTSFSVSGQIDGTSLLRGVAGGARSSGDFVPMTPHTRKDATASLGTAASTERLATIKGGITVTPLPAEGTHADESIVLWIGSLDNVSVIPAVSKFWDAQIRRSSGGGVNLFSGTTPTRMIRLQDLSTGLMGERCCGVCAAVNFAKLRDSEGGLRIEVLIRGESRLVIVRESEEEPGARVGGIVSTRRRLFSQKGAKADAPSAIIVHSKPDQPKNVSFNLTVDKNRSIRDLRSARESVVPEDNDLTHDFTMPLARPQAGFGFNLEAAADADEDDTARDIEAEMLDIMEIDQALNSMEDDRGSGRKKVLFQGH
ncbi:hypothetical protein F5X68DRAFT_207915 [Plectosphaerella plurivora]|uniref:Nucleoporin NUP37 n=1 Tax=Plectosphaerella plurivora TaxID=936078 RepID=A0A9P8VC71_9PEZI|nr:hypothetical protein F5X68DRAFT_207915 [Plectosphaerella plurivora]